MTIYVMARSPETALSCFLRGEYYTNFEDANRDRNQFGKEWHKLFQIEIPISEV